MLQLLKLLKQVNQIDCIYALNNYLIEIENEFSKIIEYATQPKVVPRKKHILKMMAQDKKALSTNQLYQRQHATCNENQLKINSKRTKMNQKPKT